MLNVKSLNPLQRVALRFTVVSLLFYGLCIVEGMIMRGQQVDPGLLDAEHYFAIMGAHPMVGIFGSSFMLVFGAFYYLVPTLLKKPIYSQKLAELTWVLMTAGVAVVWLSGFIFRYAALYTNYWPLPVAGGFSPYGLLTFAVGDITIMAGVFVFCYNLFATVVHRRGEKEPLGPLLISALGIDGFINLYRKMRGRVVAEPIMPLPVVAIFRGTIDTVLDAVVLGGISLVFLYHAVHSIMGMPLSAEWFDALAYKNIYWWGLDLIADGLVLIYVAGTWYLLATVITGKRLYMENAARAALLVELVVSWNVWSHHLLADQGQPNILKIVSGEVVTAFELVTSGIAAFVTLVTIWRARPVEMTLPMKFLLGGILGFSMGVPAGIIQADLGMNRILHNTQWVIGAHAHMQLLVGLGMTLYAALYALFPMVTNGVKLKSRFLGEFHFWAHLAGSIGMSVTMGFAGMDGMLRRTIYEAGEPFQALMLLAAAFGSLIVLAYAAMMYNVISSIGLKGLIGIFAEWPEKRSSKGDTLEAAGEKASAAQS